MADETLVHKTKSVYYMVVMVGFAVTCIAAVGITYNDVSRNTTRIEAVESNMSKIDRLQREILTNQKWLMTGLGIQPPESTEE